MSDEFRMRLAGSIEEGPGRPNSFSPSDVAAWLAAADSRPVRLELKSEGGNVGAAHEIATLLALHPAGVRVRAVGPCDSGALLLLCAGARREADPAATFHLHRITIATAAPMSAPRLRASADEIEAQEGVYVTFLAARCGLPPETVAAWMNDERTLTAAEALAFVLVERIVDDAMAVDWRAA